MRTLEQVIASRSPESQARIKARTTEILREVILARLCKTLKISQTQLTAAPGIKQPVAIKTKKVENTPNSQP
ncbi:hypothetical protein M2387_001054 [Klebsiella sp. BIGb0407]|nr:hypothetical protein [Klebsiella sp. BIGb0407]MCS3430525.1 hypothetical protein [Klebsiella sp. BIGb0407]